MHVRESEGESFLHNARPQLTCSMWQSQGKPPRANCVSARICSSLCNTLRRTHSCSLPLYACRNPCFSISHCMKRRALSDTPVWIGYSSHLSCHSVGSSQTLTLTVCQCVCLWFQAWFASLSAFMGLPHWWQLDHTCTRTFTHTHTHI